MRRPASQGQSPSLSTPAALSAIAALGIAGVAGYVAMSRLSADPSPKFEPKLTIYFYDPNGKRVRMPINLFHVTAEDAKLHAKRELRELPDGAYAVVAKTGGRLKELERVRKNPTRRKRRRAK